MATSRFVYLLVLGISGSCRDSHPPAAEDVASLDTGPPSQEAFEPVRLQPALDEAPAAPPGPGSGHEPQQGRAAPIVEILPGSGRVRGNVYTVDAWLGSTLDRGRIQGTTHVVVPNPIKEFEP